MHTHAGGRALALFVALTGAGVARAAAEDIAFVAEHLPEVAMDNRYATLPLWLGGNHEQRWRTDVGLAYTALSSQTLKLDGPMFSISASRRLNGWQLTGFIFRDQFSLTSGVEHRPLNLEFATTPLTLPAPAEFTDLNGSMSNTGLGFAASRHVANSWLGAFDWSAGLLWQSVRLSDYRLNYRVLEGPDAGAAGAIGFDATYNHFTPFVGIAKSYENGNWRLSPHAQFALPLPHRGVAGSINGPGFEISGDTDSAGLGKHFGDPSVTIGFDVTYLPWNVTFDAGTALTQAVLEPAIHKGVDRNLVLQFRWTH